MVLACLSPEKLSPCYPTVMGVPGCIPAVHVSGSPSQMGVQIGKSFKDFIGGRLSNDKTLHHSLLPFYRTREGRELVDKLSTVNRTRYPRYWEELQGTAEGSEVPFIEVLLVNLRKEIGPFLPSAAEKAAAMAADQCSDVMLCSESTALLGHNEDGDESVKGHSYIVHATLKSGITFTAYTYAGELPSCAFGFNSCGVAFTLNAVPPAASEVVWGGIGRNFVSRDLLEATDLEDALRRIQVENLAVGHNYNIMDVLNRRMVTVETASKGRFSVLEIGSEPYFHANMYLRLNVLQKANETSLQRRKRAEALPAATGVEAILEVLGDQGNAEFPIFMTGNTYEEKGPRLFTLCTTLFDLDKQDVVVYGGNPKARNELLRLPLLSKAVLTNGPTPGV